MTTNAASPFAVPAAKVELREVTIGILTALKEEYNACRRILDPQGRGSPAHARATAGALNCWLCRIPARHGGEHVVAISMLQDMGNIAAALGANILLHHCPHTSYLVMCGIAGAVPSPSQPQHHVRLGDIVVSDSGGIVQYDRGKQSDPRATAREPGPWLEWLMRLGSKFFPAQLRHVANEPFAGFDFRGPPRPPHPDLLAAVQHILADEMLLPRDAQRPWESYVADFLASESNPELWQRPADAEDVLVDSPSPKGPRIPHPDDISRRQGCPRVFLGSIGAANIVQADPVRRNYLRDRYRVKAIEMEGWGVADACWVANIGYLVIRGTCDYCNSRKNDHWHRYAALVAAGFTKTVIEYLHPFNHQPHLDQGVQDSLSKVGLESALLATVDGTHQALPRPRPASSARNMGDGHVQLNSLVNELESLMTQCRWSDATRLATHLERQLQTLSRRGADVRRGWILLAQLEVKALRDLKLAGRAPDSSRLRQLREEAESVTEY